MTGQGTEVLGVGEAGMVVEGGVQVGVSGAVAAVLVGPAGRTAEDFVATAVGDAAEFLDVDVDQFAGAGAFEAADGFAGGPVQGGQGRLTVAVEDAVGGGSGDAAAGCQPHGTDPVFAPQPQNLCLDGSRGAAGLMVRTAGAVVHALGAQLPVSAGPACGSGVADLEPFRSSPHGPAVVDDAPGQTQSSCRRQRGGDVAIHTEPRRPSPVQAPSQRVTNVLGQHI